MHSKQTGRVVFILIALAAAFWSIFWLGLKPGIDMVGGTSLLYQIKVPPGGYQSSSGHTLAEDVMIALKKRVDPEGVKNYIWRPEGADRLEIQIPASPKSDEAIKARDAYVAAQRKLEVTNISDAEVVNAVENLTGSERTARLDKLSQGMPARKQLFATLVTTYDAMLAAEKKLNADAAAIASNEYDKLKSQIDDTNLTTTQLEDALGQKDAAARAAALEGFRKEAAGFAPRLAAMDSFTDSYNAYNALKGSIADSAQLKRELQGSGVLAFHILATGDVSPSEMSRMQQQLKEKGPRPEAGDELQWFEVDKPEFTHDVAATWNGKKFLLCWITPGKSMVNGPGIPQWSMEKAYRQPEDTGPDAVGFQFDPVGGHLFHDLTANNIGKTLVTLLDNKVLTAANIRSAISDRGELTSGGNGYSNEEMAYLIDTLNAGSLPAQLEDEPISEHTVGPQLGADNLRRGLYACTFGLVVVAVFLIAYYYTAGIVATFAVFMNVVLILGILAAFGATFTLPGVAGIVLTIGAAVDANVLIFERLREEQHRGLGLRLAMKNAYSHAQTAIWDSNATTIITSLILYWLGSEEVKGFGITLLIGLLSSLFTSLFVTRTIFTIMIETFNVQHLGSLPLTFPKWDKLLKPDINWMRLVPYFVSFSAIFIALGTTAFIVTAEKGQLADVDFSSGTQVQFDLKKGMKESDVRSLFEKADNPSLPAISLTAVASSTDLGKDALPKTYEIITPNVNAKAVRTAVLDVLKNRVATDLPSTFNHSGETIETALGTAVLPIDRPDMTINGYRIPGADDYLGGAAIVLNNLNPPLRLDQIRDRLDHQRVQEQGAQGNSETAMQFHDFTIVSPAGPGIPTSFAVVLTNDPAFPHDKDEARWLQNVANPMWKLANDAVDKPGQLQKVNNFDAQVAGDTQLAALYSLVLSSLVIMAYIWFRFGNLKYGAATVMAMIHDVMLVVGAVGLSHWIPAWLADPLLITPFRVNLTIVAAVLTVMSYSMIDTIVVFDRIRENRGKFGHLSRKIVNDSINQTLSRTLLTAGTTIVTVAGMYVLGGAGIHGFTFVLLIGILVGTYSSIAIAAPILLWGGAKNDDDEKKDSAEIKRREQLPAKVSAVSSR
jgi:SecD/SecF fusion protein